MDCGDYVQNLTLYCNKAICILRIVKNCCEVVLTGVITGFCKPSCCVYVCDMGHRQSAFATENCTVVMQPLMSCAVWHAVLCEHKTLGSGYCGVCIVIACNAVMQL